MLIFVVGVGRSGTSLVQSMLASNSQVYALPETSFLRRFIFSSGNINVINDEHLDRLKDFKSKLVNSNNSKLEYKNIYLDFIKSKDSKYVLDKDPRLIEFSEQLSSLFPESKIIHIFRDPRDVLLSKKKAKWSSGRSLISYLVASRVQITDALNAEKKLNSFYSIKYEKLISSPKVELNNLCNFLSFQFEDGMLEYQAAAKQLVQKSEVSWKKETFRAINKDNSCKWVKGLSHIEALSSYYNVRAFCDTNGYEMESEIYSNLEKIIAHGLAFISLLLAGVYKTKRKYFGKI